MTKVIVFDIDGTLANIDHRTHWIRTKPKNWKAFFAAMDRDTVNEDIAWMLKNFRDLGHKIIICTGRNMDEYEITKTWLEDNDLHYHAIYMRPAKDNRMDAIVKTELLAVIREEHGEPFLWIDDRRQVVDAIRDQGVRVLQVCAGDY